MPTQPNPSRAFATLTLLLVGGLSAYLLYPALFLDRSLAHGDNIHHGYAFLKFHHDVIYEGLSPLWTNLVYGGHALFAEGQAGLSNPVNYLAAWLFPPEFGHNLLHWLAMTAFGLGCYGLCRALAISPVGALFASLAATFSSLVIHSNTSMTAIEAMAWIPLTLWSFESWLTRPGKWQAVTFGLCTAMLVFSGYPHFLHGTVIYMLASMTTLFLGGPLTQQAPRIIGRYWKTGLLAVAVCAAISCIQWLPLLELASLSHRQEGVGIAINGTVEFLIRGLFYSTNNFIPSDPPNPDYFPNTGSLLVCFLASACFLVPTSPRLKGHIVASLLLVNLGFGNLSPIYRFVTDFGIIPGIESFRMMFPYFILSIIGFAALAANTLDRLGSGAGPRWALPRVPALLGWAALLACWGALLYRYHNSAAPALNYVIAGLSLAVLAILAIARRTRAFPLSMVVLLTAEILLLKLVPFGTVETRLLTREPAAVGYIKSTADAASFRHYQLGLASLTFSNPNSKELVGRARNELDNLVASTNLAWGIPSFSGALALKSWRKPMTNDAVLAEIEGGSDDRPGQRLMDYLSIKWVSKSIRNSPTSRLLVPVRDPDGNLVVWENPYAMPTIQTWLRAQPVANAEQALQGVHSGAANTLFIEASPGELSPAQLAPPEGIPALQTLEASATRYRLHSDSTTGFWLFLADTYYPGWKATVDGAPVKIYAAQVLGKAIFVPAGKHRLKIYFQSDSFRLGALVSALAIATLVLLGALGLRRRGSPPTV